MKIPQFILIALLAMAISVEGWTLFEIINLKVALADLNGQLKSAHLIATK